jgi:hypothetical protein
VLVRGVILLSARGRVNQPDVLAIFTVARRDDARKPTGKGLPGLRATRSVAMLESQN